VDVIIQQLAKRSGVDLSQIDDDKLVAHRHEIMRHGFYRFSATTNPEIDLDLVHQALDAWSWFWSGLEAATILVLTSFVLVACGAWNPGALTLSTTLALSALGLPMIRRQGARFAVAQVREICADEQRIAQVRHAFACLTTPPSTAQRRQRAA
ncbi:MAG: hypothetical protein KDA61_21745, partial [Planctomycetales bacterium]|nr:hypothetical protein [Planctomycetales bacterium]